MFLAHMLYLWPTLVPGSQWWGAVRTRFETERSDVWLTIDDGPDPIDTPRILDLLDEMGARVTFFVKGRLASRHPDLIDQMLARGHEVASHTWSHPSATFWCLPPGRIREEIDRGFAAIDQSDSRRFRAPVGMKNSFVHPALEERGLELIGWSIRSLDTVSSDPVRVVDRVIDGLQPGAILLMHEGELASGRRGADFVEAVVRAVHASGYRLVVPAPEALR